MSAPKAKPPAKPESQPVTEEITRMGVREYRASIPQVIRAGKPIIVERHGQPVGIYTPLKQRDPERVKQLSDQLQQSLLKVQAEMGLSEEEFAQLMEADLDDEE